MNTELLKHEAFGGPLHQAIARLQAVREARSVELRELRELHPGELTMQAYLAGRLDEIDHLLTVVYELKNTQSKPN